MRVGSLFSGYGGLDLAVGGDLAWYSEIEPAACKVLASHYPDVPNLHDVTTVDWSQVEPVDVLTAGYPCQPFSVAGRRKGTSDERHLWPFVRDAIRGIRPHRIVLENVRGHVTMGFETVLLDLADLGCSARWGVVRAGDAGAPHNRARLFILADSGGERYGRGENPRMVGRLDGQDRWSRRQSGHSGKATSGGTSFGLADSEGAERRGSQPADLPSGGAEELGDRVGLAPDTPRLNTTDETESRLESVTQGGHPQDRETAWGEYWSAIRRWEHILGRAAPAPTVERAGVKRLNPIFVEWMMGLPEGWVTDHGLSLSQELKMLGNGVVPQQARLALHLLGGVA